MSLPVTIENDAIRLQLWPTIGGKISSVIDKADGAELLFTYPSEIPFDTPLYDKPYQMSWCVGWDECFPGVAPSRYVGFPYDGIACPDHGEIWSLPTQVTPTRNGITTVWHGLRFGYRLTRKITLDGAMLLSAYSLENLAPFELRYVWSQHPLFAMKGRVEIDWPGQHRCRYSHAVVNTPIDRAFEWPTLEEGVGYSRFDGLPEGKAWKVYSEKPIGEPITLRYLDRGRSVRIEYEGVESSLAYWGLWINTGGWAGHKHVGVEPTTGRFDQIDRSIWDGSAGRVAALGKSEWVVRWVLG